MLYGHRRADLIELQTPPWQQYIQDAATASWLSVSELCAVLCAA